MGWAAGARHAACKQPNLLRSSPGTARPPSNCQDTRNLPLHLYVSLTSQPPAARWCAAAPGTAARQRSPPLAPWLAGSGMPDYLHGARGRGAGQTQRSAALHASNMAQQQRTPQWHQRVGRGSTDRKPPTAGIGSNLVPPTAWTQSRPRAMQRLSSQKKMLPNGQGRAVGPCRPAQGGRGQRCHGTQTKGLCTALSSPSRCPRVGQHSATAENTLQQRRPPPKPT